MAEARVGEGESLQMDSGKRKGKISVGKAKSVSSYNDVYERMVL